MKKAIDWAEIAEYAQGTPHSEAQIAATYDLTPEQETEKTSQAKDREGKLKTDAEGRPIYNEDTTYHANLRQALTVYLDKCLKPSREVSGVLKRLSEAEQRIAEMKI